MRINSLPRLALLGVITVAVFGCSSGSTEQIEVGESYVPAVSIGITLSSDDESLIEDFCRLDPGMDRSDVEWFMRKRPRWSDEHRDAWETSVATLRVTYGADHKTVEWLEAAYLEKGFDFPCRWLRG